MTNRPLGMFGLLRSLQNPYRLPVEGTTECLDPDELVAMVEGTLPPERTDHVLAHVDVCEACAEVVAALGSGVTDSRRVGRYELERVLGTGAMGIVHRAWDPELRRHVAIKLVRPERANAGSRARMLREARSLARIQHPNVVAVHDVGEHAGQIYLATEFVDGETLESWAAGKPADAVLDAWIQVARGLGAAHAEGVLHRDVKPANVFVGRDGRARIGDFGLARADTADPSTAPAPALSAAELANIATARSDEQVEVPSTSVVVTAPGALAGTPAYMAPEQWRGGFEARSDQFALCVGVVEGLEGARPAAGAAIALAGVQAPWTALQRAALAAALTRGLAIEPAERFPSITALVDALAAARSLQPPHRRSARWLAAGAGALALGAVATWRVVRTPDGDACTLATGELITPARKAAFGPLAAPVEHWATAWTEMAHDVCTTPAGELRDRRTMCMAESLDKMRALLDHWDGKLPDAMLAYTALEDIPHPTRCTTAAVQAIPEPTLAQRMQIAAARVRIAHATTREGLKALVDEARAIGHPPFTVEAYLALADAQPPDSPIQIAVLRDALAAARDDYWFGVATYRLLAKLGVDPDNEATRLADAARTRLIAVGDAFVEASVDAALGDIATRKGRWEDAIGSYERARRGFRLVYGADSVQDGVVLVALGVTYYRRDPHDARGEQLYAAGAELWVRGGLPEPPNPFTRDPKTRMRWINNAIARATEKRDRGALADAEYLAGSAYALLEQPAEALRHYERTVELHDQLHKVEGGTIGSLEQIASLRIELGRPADALAPARRAAELAAARKIDLEIGSTLTTLGEALLANGRHAEARDVLERAVVLRDKEAARPRGATRFFLARALWKSDRERGRMLAASARQDTESALAEVEQNPDLPDREFTRRVLQSRLAKIKQLVGKR